MLETSTASLELGFISILSQAFKGAILELTVQSTEKAYFAI